jgi:hypothetical protein
MMTWRWTTVLSVACLLCFSRSLPAVQSPTTAPDVGAVDWAEVLPKVSLHLQGATREQALAEFSKATGFKFTQPEAGFWTKNQWATPVVDVDIDGKNFWDALGAFQEATDLGFIGTDNGYAGSQQQPARVTPTHERGDWGWTGRPEAVCGPLLVSVRQVNRTTHAPADAASAAWDRIAVRMQARLAPEADWHLDEDGWAMTSLRTDQGLELQPQAQPNFTRTSQMGDTFWAEFDVRAPADAKISSLRFNGVCRGSLVTRTDLVEIKDAENTPLDRTVAGLQVHLVTLRSGSSIEVRISWATPTTQPMRQRFQAARTLQAYCQGHIHLYDAKGEKLSAIGMSPVGFRREMYLASRYQPAGAPGPLKLVWQIPLESRDVLFAVQIDEIPAPQ